MAPTAQLTALGLSQSLGESRHIVLGAGHPGQFSQTEDAQNRQPGLVATPGFARLGHLGQAFQQAGQLTGGHWAAHRERPLILSQRWRQLLGFELRCPLRIQSSHPQLFGSIMSLVEVLSTTAKARGRTQQRPTRGLISGAAKELAIYETLHRHDRVPMLLQPILRKALAAQTQSPRRQVGKLQPIT